jgi:SPP1 gp7 family putative phage head morphogenesis protein
MTRKPPALGVGLVAPRDASAFFASKKALLPSYHWDDVYASEHAAGVAVAGITQRDMLQLVADELQRTIDAGGDLRDFKRRMQPMLAKAGYWGDVEVTDPATGDKRITKFNPRRLELIFGTNVRQAQTAGQYKRALAAKADFPYLVYLSRDDDQVRPLHKAWHGTVLPVEHPFWQTHLPPCGWNCRCRFMAVTEADIERFAKRGVPIKREPPKGWQDTVDYVRKGTGEVVQVPRGIDPGFDHNPATSRLRGVVPQFVDMPLPPTLPTILTPLPRLPLPTPVAADVLMPSCASLAPAPNWAPKCLRM